MQIRDRLTAELLVGARFLVASLTTATVQYTTLIVGAQFTSSLVASIGAYALAIPVNYSLSYYVTFKSKTGHRTAMPRFLAVSFTGLGLNTVIFWLAIDARVYYVLAQILATIGVSLWSYIALKMAFGRI